MGKVESELKYYWSKMSFPLTSSHTNSSDGFQCFASILSSGLGIGGKES